MQRVYLVTLSKDTESPLAPKSDEVGKGEKKDKSADEKKANPDDKKNKEEIERANVGSPVTL